MPRRLRPNIKQFIPRLGYQFLPVGNYGNSLLGIFIQNPLNKMREDNRFASARGGLQKGKIVLLHSRPDGV
jgi:hypothetical protein